MSYIDAPEVEEDKPLQVLVSSIDYNDYVGRIAVGRIDRGTMKTNSEVELCDYHDGDLHKSQRLRQFTNLTA